MYTKLVKHNLKLTTLISNISLFLDCTQSNLNFEPSFAGIHEILKVIWLFEHKGLVKLIKRVKIAHSFLVCVRSVPHYHFKLAYVILQMIVKEFSKPTSKNGEIGRLIGLY